jgi:hypothetical protein
MNNISRPLDTTADAFTLTRVRDSFADWFASAPRVTVPSLVEVQHILEVEEEMVTVRREGEAHPLTAGAISGAVGGAAMLSVGAFLAKSDLPTTIGTLISRGHLSGTSAFVTAWVVMMAAGALLGSGFAWLTRRLRNLPALLSFGMLFSGAAWICIQALAMKKLAPYAAHTLPVVPMILGAMAFGLVTAMQLPIRTKRLF